MLDVPVDGALVPEEDPVVEVVPEPMPEPEVELEPEVVLVEAGVTTCPFPSNCARPRKKKDPSLTLPEVVPLAEVVVPVSPPVPVPIRA